MLVSLSLLAVNVPLSTLTISELSDFQITDWSALSGLTTASNSIEVGTSIELLAVVKPDQHYQA